MPLRAFVLHFEEYVPSQATPGQMILRAAVAIADDTPGVALQMRMGVDVELSIADPVNTIRAKLTDAIVRDAAANGLTLLKADIVSLNLQRG